MESRQYFIECEKKYRNQASSKPRKLTSAELFAQQAAINLEHQNDLKNLRGQIDDLKTKIGDEPELFPTNRAPEDTYTLDDLRNVKSIKGFSVKKIDEFLNLYKFPKKSYTQIHCTGRHDERGRQLTYDVKKYSWQKQGINKIVNLIMRDSLLLNSTDLNHKFTHPKTGVFYVKVGFNDAVETHIARLRT